MTTLMVLGDQGARKKVMTKRFKSVDENDLVLDVSRVMEEKKIYSLIVKNSKKRITGLIRMHEILSLIHI